MSNGPGLGKEARRADRYSSFAELEVGEILDVDYAIFSRKMESPFLVAAPHGGHIEPGTSEVAAAIAAGDMSLYLFEGLRPGRAHSDLHITSDRFDEPEALRLARSADTVLGVHGRSDRDDAETIWIGGRDAVLREAIGGALAAAGFRAGPAPAGLAGRSPANICNRGRRGVGVQIEIPFALRGRLINDADLRGSITAAIRATLAASTRES